MMKFITFLLQMTVLGEGVSTLCSSACLYLKPKQKPAIVSGFDLALYYVFKYILLQM